MDYRLIKRIPTMLGATVDIAETAAGERVIIKRAESESEVANLQAYVRHLLVMNQLLGEDSIYPPVLHHTEHELVLPFFRNGSLDTVEDRVVTRQLTGRVIDSLFRIAILAPPSAPSREEGRNYSQAFLTGEATSRLSRLERVLRSDSLAKAWASKHSRTIEGLTSWISDSTLDRAAPALAPPSLGLAAHGDLGLNNVVLRDLPSSTAALVFIDTRGRWRWGLPWWDPIMDVATLIAFHCRIEPALLDFGGSGRDPDREQYRLSEAEILDLCAASDAFQTWTQHDPRWHARLQISLATRLLGSISIQLTIAPQHRAERATAVLRLYAEQVGRVREAIG